MVVQSPLDLQSKFHFQDTPGGIHFVLSFFGNLLYNQRTVVQIVIPSEDNEFGCDEHVRPKDLLINQFVLLVRRGSCTYAKKTYEAQDVGAFAVIIEDQEDRNID